MCAAIIKCLFNMCPSLICTITIRLEHRKLFIGYVYTLSRHDVNAANTRVENHLGRTHRHNVPGSMPFTCFVSITTRSWDLAWNCSRASVSAAVSVESKHRFSLAFANVSPTGSAKPNTKRTWK